VPSLSDATNFYPLPQPPLSTTYMKNFGTLEINKRVNRFNITLIVKIPR